MVVSFSVSDDAADVADVAAPEVVDSDPPPADCEELEDEKEGEGEEHNPYDNERWVQEIMCPT